MLACSCSKDALLLQGHQGKVDGSLECCSRVYQGEPREGGCGRSCGVDRAWTACKAPEVLKMRKDFVYHILEAFQCKHLHRKLQCHAHHYSMGHVKSDGRTTDVPRRHFCCSCCNPVSAFVAFSKRMMKEFWLLVCIWLLHSAASCLLLSFVWLV